MAEKSEAQELKAQTIAEQRARHIAALDKLVSVPRIEGKPHARDRAGAQFLVNAGLLKLP